jgi:uncharacterized membrane protein YgdD (TMEM256/DUF423 family)
MDRTFLVLGAFSGFIGVGLGAFGTHALRNRLTPARLTQFETGVRYQLWHTLALFVVPIVGSVRSPNLGSSGYTQLVVLHPFTLPIALADWLFTAGIVLFSGSLYALALSGNQRWGAVTPFGGMCFLLGWLALIWAALTI